MASKEGARKSGTFMAVNTTPDVCKTPMGNTVVPVPYAITSNLNDSMSTSSNVNFGGDPAFILGKSSVTKVTGDEPGTAGGVKSGTNRACVKPTAGSSTVRVNKKQVIRHGDPCDMNNGNTQGKIIYQGASSPKGSNSKADSNPPVKPETPNEEKAKEEKTGLWSRMSDGVHTALDVAGFIPGLGAIPDILNAGIYAAEGNAAMAALSVVAAVPGVGDGVKAGSMAYKGGKQLLKQAEKKAAKEATEQAVKKTEKEIVEEGGKKKAQKEAAQDATKESSEAAAKKGTADNVHVKGKKSNETGKCGEWLAKMDMAKEGYDEVVAVQNKSGHGVDLIGRKSDGSVKVWEVKTTETANAPGLKGDQAKWGGEKFTNDRLGRAASGKGNYGKVPEAKRNAIKVQKWLEKAKDKVTYEKREVFVDDISKGCGKHPKRQSKSKPWIGKSGNI